MWVGTTGYSLRPYPPLLPLQTTPRTVWPPKGDTHQRIHAPLGAQCYFNTACFRFKMGSQTGSQSATMLRAKQRSLTYVRNDTFLQEGQNAV